MKVDTKYSVEHIRKVELNLLHFNTMKIVPVEKE